MSETPNKFSEYCNLQIEKVENGYKVVQGVEFRDLYGPSQGASSIPDYEYVFTRLEDVYGFLKRHYETD